MATAAATTALPIACTPLLVDQLQPFLVRTSVDQLQPFWVLRGGGFQFELQVDARVVEPATLLILEVLEERTGRRLEAEIDFAIRHHELKGNLGFPPAGLKYKGFGPPPRPSPAGAGAGQGRHTLGVQAALA